MNNLNSIFLSLGSNIGDKAYNLKTALNKLSQILEIKKISSIYETEPLLHQNQDNFLNIIAEVSYSQKAENLLINIKDIEKNI